MRNAREPKISDLPLRERIYHYMLQEQDKQRRAADTANEDLVRRKFEPMVYTPRIKVPSDRKLKAMPSEVAAEVRKLVRDGRLVLRPFGHMELYEVVVPNDEGKT